jgi:hypothetical protein
LGPLRIVTGETGDDVSNLEDDLKATVETLQTDVEALKDIEDLKADLEPTDPRIRDLSRAAESLGKRVAIETTVERELADQVAGA